MIKGKFLINEHSDEEIDIDFKQRNHYR